MIPILCYGVEYGSSFGSIVALEKRGQPYRLCRLELPRDSQGDTYRGINPMREVPALITADAAVLTESVAILHHLAADDPAGRLGDAASDRFHQVLAFLNSRYFSAFNPLWFSMEFADERQKAALRGEGEKLVELATTKLEALLGDADWLAGDRMTVADTYYAGIARWNDVHGVVDWAHYPRAKALFDRVEQDAEVRFAHAIEDGAGASSAHFHGHVTLAEVAAAVKRG